MAPGDILLTLVRWVHLLAAATLVGGSLLRVLGGRSALADQKTEPQPPQRKGKTKGPGVMNLILLVLVGTGMIIGLDRLGQPEVGSVYIAVLIAKLCLVLALGYTVSKLKSGPGATRRFMLTPDRMVAGIGATILLLSVGLMALFENGLK